MHCVATKTQIIRIVALVLQHVPRTGSGAEIHRDSYVVYKLLVQLFT